MEGRKEERKERWKEGKKKRMKEERKEGRKEGRKEERKEGKKKGRKEGRRERRKKGTKTPGKAGNQTAPVVDLVWKVPADVALLSLVQVIHEFGTE